MSEKQYVTTSFIIDGCKVVINRPILTAEERRRAEQNIVSALSKFKENKR